MALSLDHLIDATGWSIIHSLWIGALAYGLLLLLFAAFPETPSRTRHAMAFSSLALLFIGFLAVFLRKLDISFGHVEPGGRAADFPLALLLLETVEPPSVPFFDYLVGGYVAGFGLQTVLLAWGYLRVRNLRRSGLLPASAAWERTFVQTLSRMGIRRHVGLWLSEKVKTPLVVGYLKPVVLFPVALSSRLDMAQVEAILIHELSHVRRNDYLLNLFKTVVETVLFFNPFVWLLGRIINEERENACDDEVLEQTGRPMHYAQTLLHVAMLAGGIGRRICHGGRRQEPIATISTNQTYYGNENNVSLCTPTAVGVGIRLAGCSLFGMDRTQGNHR